VLAVPPPSWLPGLTCTCPRPPKPGVAEGPALGCPATRRPRGMQAGGA
jgi:hypothetical protein